MYENDILFILQKHKVNFAFFEIPPGLYDVVDIKKTLDNLLKVNVFIDIITMRSNLKTNIIASDGILRINEKRFFCTMLRFCPN